jgi:hypothetical protein
VDWLNKYIQLKGTQGQYSEEAIEWLSKAEKELMKEREKEEDDFFQLKFLKSNNIEDDPIQQLQQPLLESEDEEQK